MNMKSLLSTKIHCCPRWLHRARGLWLSGTVLTLFSATTSAVDSAVITVTTTVVAPTCTMTVPSAINFNAVRNPIVTADLVGEGISSDVPIKFTNCANGSFNRTPKIAVTGRTMTLGSTALYFVGSAASGNQTRGYGVKLSVQGDTNFANSTNIATRSGDNGGGDLTVNAGKTMANLNNTTLTLKAQLSCGAYSPCESAPSHAVGAFKASATFQLQYD